MDEWKPITTSIALSHKAYLVYDPKEYYPPMMAKFITGRGWVTYDNYNAIYWNPTHYIEIPDVKEISNE